MYFDRSGLKIIMHKSDNLTYVFKEEIKEFNNTNKGSFYEKNANLLQFFEYDLKKNIMSNLFLNKLLEVRRGKRGSNIIISFRFFRNNLRVIVFLETFGYILYSVTGGIVAKIVLGNPRVYRRDKKGDGTLNFIGFRVKKKIIKCLRKFYIAKIKLYLASYFRRYMFFRLIKRFVFKKIKRQVYVKIPHGHNSMESAKRWRKKRRK